MAAARIQPPHARHRRPRLQHPTMASTGDASAAILDANQRLLNAIAAGDYAEYSALCSADLTAFEPEAKGHLVVGLPFHK
jgi:calcium/calmodulin-dependent protein kinase (CaM kinase) II